MEGVDGIDDTKNHGVIASGYNPKDSPEMFVKKIMQNQKRIQYTIDEFVKEKKLGKEIKIVHQQKKEEGEAKDRPTPATDGKVEGNWSAPMIMPVTMTSAPQIDKDSAEAVDQRLFA